MTEIRDWYLELTNPQKQVFFETVGANLAVIVRAHHDGNLLRRDRSADNLRGGINELHHQLFQQIEAIGTGRGRYSDSLFWDHLLCEARYYKLTENLSAALESARALLMDGAKPKPHSGHAINDEKLTVDFTLQCLSDLD